MTSKARKALVDYCGVQLEGYQLPSGNYTLSRSQVAYAIGQKRGNSSVIEFLNSKSPEALSCKELLVNETDLAIGKGCLTIKATPIRIAILYWTYWASKGNLKAQALVAAGAEETITRLFDNAFGVVKTEQQYQTDSTQARKEFEVVLSVMQRLETKIDSMETELKLLRPAYEKLQKIESSLEDYPNLQEALEYLMNNINKTKKSYSLGEWLKDNNLEYIPSNVRMSIGRLIASWCKLIEFKAPKGKYSDAFDPVLRFAVNYKLTQENK